MLKPREFDAGDRLPLEIRVGPRFREALPYVLLGTPFVGGAAFFTVLIASGAPMTGNAGPLAIGVILGVFFLVGGLRGLRPSRHGLRPGHQGQP